jgi:acetyltransferase-like isoleucine patch superfamily enzyme
MIKNGVTKFINSIGLRSHISLIRGWKGSWRYKRQIEADKRQMRQWLAGFEEQEVNIHASTEFTGRLPFDGLKIGRGAAIERDVTIWMSSDESAEPVLEVKERVFIGRNSYIGVYQPIFIGTNTIIGAYSYLISGNHRYEQRGIPIRDQGFDGTPIVIEDDVWIGTHVVVLPGVTIGKGAIVAAGSIVSKNIPPYEVWGGVPAKFLKHRPDE